MPVPVPESLTQTLAYWPHQPRDFFQPNGHSWGQLALQSEYLVPIVDTEIRIYKCLYEEAMARTMSRKITPYLNLYRAFARSAKRPELSVIVVVNYLKKFKT